MLDAGTRLGPYEIQSALGAGGMGEVYKARDTRLDRVVAVKILPATLAADPQFRERFDREARAISQLSHPNICTLHDVGEHEGTAFLVMELLDGETLEARLSSVGRVLSDPPGSAGSNGPRLQVDQALAIAIQIADALAVAHRAGIIHRDLKPGNIFLVRSGGASAPPVAKLLDFGLAKTSAPAIGTSGATMAPTTPVSVTAQGTILGTFQYMAPEQIEGMEADARTDLFAFGCVLYEMLTGRKAFEGKTRASLLGAILKDEPPPVSRTLPVAPPALDRLVQTCLAKDPEDRWQTARDLQRELKWVAASGAIGHAQPTSNSGGFKESALHQQRGLPIVAAALASAVIVGGAVWALTRQAAVPLRPIKLQATPPATAPLFIDGIAPDIALSPDGTRVAYTAGTGQAQLWVRQLDQAEATQLPGITNARGPFFSPDGEWIGYFQATSLKKVSFHGGPSLTVCADCAGGNRGATWGTSDVIVFASEGGSLLQKIPAAGGDRATVATPDNGKGELAYLWPEFLPDGQAILLTIAGTSGIDNASIAWRDVKTGRQEILIHGGSQPHYVTTGHIAYGISGTLRAVEFDLTRRAVIGSAVPVMEHVLTKPNGSADFSVSRDGSLVYIAGDSRAAGLRLAWVDRQGHEEPIDAPLRAYLYVRLSPDGRHAALDIRDQQNDIWIWDFERHVLARLTTDPSLDQSPVWTPDGRRILFASQRDGVLNLYGQLADGTGGVERLHTSTRIQVPWAIAPDGKTIILRDTDPRTGPDISVMSVEGDHSVKPLIRTAFTEANAEVSTDGRWIAYQSDESGRSEIYVRPFPNVDGGHWQVSTEGGSRPVWARSGRELFFVDLRGRLMALPVQPGVTFTTGNPIAIVEGISGATALGRNYDVSPDGRRFLLIRNASGTDEKTPPPQLNVVLNWGEELKRLAPVRR